MAAARCDQHGKPRGRTYQYGGPYLPLEPMPALICGRTRCNLPASVVWLKSDEEERYQQGERVFDLNTYSGAKIAVR